MSIRYTRNLFLRAICVVYLFAFVSFYVQIPGLYGDNGVLPARSLLENSRHQTLSGKVHYQPTLLWLAPYLGLNTHYALDLLALLGCFLAFTGFVSQKFCTVPLFAALWSLYFSLVQIGQVFVKYQSDSLLLETGFLCILVAPLLPIKKQGSKVRPSDHVTFWLVRWLLFRLLVTSGLAKLLSGCPKWWDLSALSLHLESMPLPSPLSWYGHHLPMWVLRLAAVYTNACEIFLPFLFFIPSRKVLFTGFVFQLLLQICTVLTGNFNYLNLLTVALTISLLDDQSFYTRRSLNNGFAPVLGNIFNFLVHGALLYAIVILYSIKIKESHIEAHIAFTKEQFSNVVKEGLILTKYVAFISLMFTALKSIYSYLTEGTTIWSKIVSVLSIIFFSITAVFIFTASTVPMDSLHAATNATVEPSVRVAYNRLHKLHIINEYDLFKRMTGSDGRPEIVFEGSYDLDGPWIEYNFLYKPGNVNHSLPFVAPYSPRLDWQMWFSARSTYSKEPWLLALAHRLLLGRPEVLALLDHAHSPFNAKPPRYIRATLYKYKYTAWSARHQPVWWTREKVAEYFPAYTKDSPPLVDYLKARNLLPLVSKTPVNAVWKRILDSIRYITSHMEATLLLWSIFTAGCAVITTSAKSF